MNIIIKLFVTLFYIGNLKKIPGTFGSLFSLILLFPFFYFKFFSIEVFIFIFVFIFLISLYFIEIYSKILNKHDSNTIVIDEFLGIYLIYLFYEKIYFFNNFFTICLIFIVFRFYDIKKIYPANIIDKKIKNSFGVILDDIVAAIYTIVTLYLITHYV